MGAVSSTTEIDPEVEEVFQESEDPALTAVEVAEGLDITQQAAHSKLSKEHAKGNLKRKKVGSRAVVWWIDD